MSGTLGILGGGQLGRMMALAAAPLGVRCFVLDPDPDACAGDVCTLLTGRYDDPAALDRLADRTDTVTFEFENVPPAALELASQRFRLVRPGPACLRASADRLLERGALQQAGIRVAPFAAVDCASSLRAAVHEVGMPAILKSRTGGYDGKGQAPCETAADAEQAWASIGRRPAILEQRLAFTRELSVIVCRASDGSLVHAPVTENTHANGILIRSDAPAQVDDPVRERATGWAASLAESLGHIGVLTLELFETPDGLIANEFAPRVHNSGHWTIEGARTSQFENHVRAVLGLPLGSTAPTGSCVMLNLLGRMPDSAGVLSEPGAHLHDYRKRPKPGRKVGHVTVCLPTREEAAAAADRLAAATGGTGRVHS